MLKLEKPIVFLDLETTGLDREKDRIVQLSFQKLLPDFTIAQHEINMLINPLMIIPPASMAIHGITQEMVRLAPTFADVAVELFAYLIGCDLGGFNSNWFDIPLLHNEFRRCGINLNPANFKMIDVGNLFKIMEPRNLENAVKFYCNSRMINAHNAKADNAATIGVFLMQLDKYDELPDTMSDLALLTNYGQQIADLSGKFAYNDEGVLCLNFGKYKGQPAAANIDFVNWMYYKADFAPDTRAICEDIMGLTNALSPDSAACLEDEADLSDLPF